MMYSLVRDLAADGIPVVVTCGVLGFSPQAFYKWSANPVSKRDWDDADLVDAAREIHADDPVFGYRFIADELAAEHGIEASENRVQRLCSAHGVSRCWLASGAAGPSRRSRTRRSGATRLRRQGPKTSCGSPTSPRTRQRASSTFFCP